MNKNDNNDDNMAKTYTQKPNGTKLLPIVFQFGKATVGNNARKTLLV